MSNDSNTSSDPRSASAAQSREAVAARAPGSAAQPFDAVGIKRRYAGAFRPNPRIFWPDMLASALLGWGAFALAVAERPGSALHLAYSAISIFALLRGVLFIHELAHLKRGALPGFEVVWHLVVGVPLLAPSLLYVGPHADHHRKATFGTRADPEYVPLGTWSHARILGFVFSVVVVPLLLPLRWGLVAPLSRFIPGLRRLAVERASTLAINPDYRRPMPTGRHVARWAVQESVMCAAVWTLVALAYAGRVPAAWLLQWYGLVMGIAIVNQLRTLVAHLYTNPGVPVDVEGMLRDSINLTGRLAVSVLPAPVGLRYHALHHFLPSLPYHSLGAAHRRLCAELPAQSPYRAASRTGMLSALRDLWARTG